MKPCRTCGEALGNQMTVCTACGTDQEPPIARVVPSPMDDRLRQRIRLRSIDRFEVLFAIPCSVIGAILGGWEGALIGFVIGGSLLEACLGV